MDSTLRVLTNNAAIALNTAALYSADTLDLVSDGLNYIRTAIQITVPKGIYIQNLLWNEVGFLQRLNQYESAINQCERYRLLSQTPININTAAKKQKSTRGKPTASASASAAGIKCNGINQLSSGSDSTGSNNPRNNRSNPPKIKYLLTGRAYWSWKLAELYSEIGDWATAWNYAIEAREFHSKAAVNNRSEQLSIPDRNELTQWILNWDEKAKAQLLNKQIETESDQSDNEEQQQEQNESTELNLIPATAIDLTTHSIDVYNSALELVIISESEPESELGIDPYDTVTVKPAAVSNLSKSELVSAALSILSNTGTTAPVPAPVPVPAPAPAPARSNDINAAIDDGSIIDITLLTSSSEDSIGDLDKLSSIDNGITNSTADAIDQSNIIINAVDSTSSSNSSNSSDSDPDFSFCPDPDHTPVETIIDSNRINQLRPRARTTAIATATATAAITVRATDTDTDTDRNDLTTISGNNNELTELILDKTELEQKSIPISNNNTVNVNTNHINNTNITPIINKAQPNIPVQAVVVESKSTDSNTDSNSDSDRIYSLIDNNPIIAANRIQLLQSNIETNNNHQQLLIDSNTVNNSFKLKRDNINVSIINNSNSKRVKLNIPSQSQSRSRTRTRS